MGDVCSFVEKRGRDELDDSRSCDLWHKSFIWKLKTIKKHWKAKKQDISACAGQLTQNLIKSQYGLLQYSNLAEQSTKNNLIMIFLPPLYCAIILRFPMLLHKINKEQIFETEMSVLCKVLLLSDCFLNFYPFFSPSHSFFLLFDHFSNLKLIFIANSCCFCHF